MEIKKFESYSTADAINVWCVLLSMEDWRGSDSIKCIGCYTTEMLAADRLIKFVNRNYKQNFEPFFEDNTRLFTDITQNGDYDECINFCEEKSINIYIDNTKLYTNADEN